MVTKNDNCPIEHTLSLISGKWKSVIIHNLLQQKVCRFSELEHLIPDCSRRMLALQLKALEQAHLVQKHVYPVVPPKTDYSLTEKGKSLRPIVEGMQDWGQKN